MASRVFSIGLRAAEKDIFPHLRKWVWKRLYNLLSRSWPDADWRFMNYGYLPPPGQAGFALEARDEPDRAFIGLYHQAVAGLAVEGSRVLEVGCGRGGGAAYVARYFRPASMVGLDYSPITLRRARRLNAGCAALQFRTGDAEALPFADASFDIVINIESSHCYADMARFVSEVARVLKPGGWFCWADMRGTTQIDALDRSFDHPALMPVHEADITEGVVRALDVMNERKTARIARAPLLRRFLLEFAGTRGSMLYQGFGSGHVHYLSRRYRKRTASEPSAAAPDSAEAGASEGEAQAPTP